MHHTVHSSCNSCRLRTHCGAAILTAPVGASYAGRRLGQGKGPAASLMAFAACRSRVFQWSRASMDHLRYKFCHSCGLTVAFIIFYAGIFSYFNLVIFPRLIKPFLTDFYTCFFSSLFTYFSTPPSLPLLTLFFFLLFSLSPSSEVIAS